MSIHEEIYEGHLIRANATAAMVFLDGSKNLETKFRAMDLEDAINKSKAWIDEKTRPLGPPPSQSSIQRQNSCKCMKKSQKLLTA